MCLFKSCAATLVCLLLSMPLVHAQYPEVIYLQFDGAQPPQNIAIPGIPMTFPPFVYPYNVGVIGSALNLSAGYLSVPCACDLHGDWTIEFWTANNTPSPPWPLQLYDLLFTGGNFHASIGEIPGLSPHLRFFISEAGQNYDLIMTPFNIGAWNHFAVTYDVDTLTLRSYLNGNLVKTQVTASALPLTIDNDLAFGYQSSSGSSGYQGRIDELRIWSRERSAAEIAANASIVLQPLTNDLRIVEMLTPQTATFPGELTNSEPVSVKLVNYGSTTLAAGTLMTWSYSVNGSSPVIESSTLAAPLAFTDTLSHVFSTPADLSAVGVHQISVTCSTNDNGAIVIATQDFSVSNDTPGMVRDLPWVEPFRSKPMPFESNPFALPPGWSSEIDGQPDPGYLRYEPGMIDTHTETTIPYGDSTLRYQFGPFLHDAVATLKSPDIILSGVTNPRLGFWFKSFSFHAPAQIMVDVEDVVTGLTTSDVTLVPLPLGEGFWTRTTCDLSAFIGQKIRIHLRLDFISNPSLSPTPYRIIDFDDFSIVDLGVQGLGQAPQAGLATLEINDSFGVGHDRPRSGDAGPYFTMTRAGELIEFHFNGEPDQWLSLFWGAVHPASIDYGAVGLCDVGDGFDFNTGLPANIWIVANGFAPTQPIDFLFKTDINGDLFLSTLTPPLPRGSNGAFQALFGTNNGSWFALSNAVELMVR